MRLAAHWSLLFALPLAAQTAQPIRVLLAGDAMLARNIGRKAREAKDPALAFREIAPLLAEADIAFLNLESPFSDQGPPADQGMIFKAEPEMIEGLEVAGIDIVSTANNHARDRKAYGLEFTLDWLAKHGIAAVGTGKTVEEARQGAVIERKGVRFGFLAYTFDANNGNWPDSDPRINLADAKQLKADITAMRDRADVVIVSMHHGWEYRTKVNDYQRRFAHAAIDAGASAVIGHHPHVRQATETYQNGPIFYSLGNFVFDQTQPGTREGAIAELVFEGKNLRSARELEIEIVGGAPRLKPAPQAAIATTGAR